MRLLSLILACVEEANKLKGATISVDGLVRMVGSVANKRLMTPFLSVGKKNLPRCLLGYKRSFGLKDESGCYLGSYSSIEGGKPSPLLGISLTLNDSESGNAWDIERAEDHSLQ